MQSLKCVSTVYPDGYITRRSARFPLEKKGDRSYGDNNIKGYSFEDINSLWYILVILYT